MTADDIAAARRDVVLLESDNRRSVALVPNAGMIARYKQALDALEGERGVLFAAVVQLGGMVEGQPTSRVNFLQRIEELRRIESNAMEAEMLAATSDSEAHHLRALYADAVRALRTADENIKSGVRSSCKCESCENDRRRIKAVLSTPEAKAVAKDRIGL